MKYKSISLLAINVLVCQVGLRSQPEPFMVERGREVYKNTFDEPVAQIFERKGNNWQLFTTRWSIENGVLLGRPATKEVQAANEEKKMKKNLLGGVPRVFMHKTLPLDFVCSFRIKFTGGTTTRIDPHIEWGHHLMRVWLKDESIQFLTDQEKVVMDEWKPGIVRDQWYDVLLERKDERFVLRFGANTFSGKLDSVLKTRKHFKNYREGRPDMLGISGTKDGTVEIDDLYIWEAGEFLKEDSH